MARKAYEFADPKRERAVGEGGFTPVAFKVPKGMELFKFSKEGHYRINVMPFVVGKNNPGADEGQLHYCRTYYGHAGIGANEDMYCCPAQCAGKKCGICEDVAKMRRKTDTDPELLKALRPKQRQLFVFDVLNMGEKDKGFQLYEASYWFGFGEILKNKLDGIDEDSPYHNFSHPEDGYTLVVHAKPQKTPYGMKVQATNIEFEARKRSYEMSVIEEIPCLDDLLILLPYDELLAHYNQEDPEDAGPAKSAKKKPADDDEEDNGPAKPAAKKKPADDDEDEEKPKKKPKPADDDEEPTAESKGIKVESVVRHKEHGVCEVVHVSGDGTSVRIKDEDDEIHKGIAPKELQLVKTDDDDEDEKPAKKKPKPAEDDDEEEKPKKKKPTEDDDDDGGPPPKKKPKPAASDDDEEEKPKKKKPAEDDDDEDNGPAKPAKKPATSGSKRKVDDDDD